MPSDYKAIRKDNIRRRGEEFDDIGRFIAEQLYSDRSHFVYAEISHTLDAPMDPIRGVLRPGNPNFCLVDGYSRLWAELSRPIADVIQLDRPVTAIAWSDEGVVAHVSGQSFEAKTAILTLPVGVLQAGGIDFRPALPEVKRRAIEQVDPGPLIKVLAEFRRPWWEDRVGNVPSIRNSTPSAFSYFKVPFWNRPGPPLGELRHTLRPADHG